MDRRERFEDLGVALLAAFQGMQAGLWSAMPGIIQSFDPAAMSVQVQVAVQSQFLDSKGGVKWDSPLLVDCPVCFPGGGGFTLTFPIAAGDECLVVFASRCIDLWWKNGGVQQQAELRMHDLSDGFAIVGVRSQPRRITVDMGGVRLRNDTDDAYIEIQNGKNIKASTPGSVDVVAGGNLTATITGTANVSSGGTATVQAPTIQLTGNVNVTGNLSVSGTMLNNGTNVGRTHVHSNVTNGPNLSGGPQ